MDTIYCPLSMIGGGAEREPRECLEFLHGVSCSYCPLEFLNTLNTRMSELVDVLNYYEDSFGTSKIASAIERLADAVEDQEE